MNRVADIMEWILSSRQMSWPMLFVLGVMAGVLIGLATGLPVTGHVIAGTSPLSSVMPDRPGPIETALAEKFRSANAARDAAPPPSFRAPTSRVVEAAPISDQGADPVRTVASRLERPGALMGSGAHPVPIELAEGSSRPKIAIVVDDLGLDEAAFDRINQLPGPLTLAFLPYGQNAQAMVDRIGPDHQPIMHLPMEPMVDIDSAGPGMLRADADLASIRSALRLNLSRLDGIIGVNNHTGSRFTADPVRMAVVLEELDARGLFFLDSLTTRDRVAMTLAEGRGWRVKERDVFLDGEWPNVTVASVKDQLTELERIARRNGAAIGIAHPYPDTIDTLGPWLVTAEARGFDLVPVSELMPPSKRRQTLAKLR